MKKIKSFKLFENRIDINIESDLKSAKMRIGYLKSEISSLEKVILNKVEPEIRELVALGQYNEADKLIEEFLKDTNEYDLYKKLVIDSKLSKE